MRSDRLIGGGGRVLAEILIIVVGVLIALAVDSWPTQRSQERTEQTYLKSLAEDIEQDIAQIDSASAVIRGRQAAARAALPIVRGKNPVRDTLQFIQDLSRATLLGSY